MTQKPRDKMWAEKFCCRCEELKQVLYVELNHRDAEKLTPAIKFASGMRFNCCKPIRFNTSWIFMPASLSAFNTPFLIPGFMLPANIYFQYASITLLTWNIVTISFHKIQHFPIIIFYRWISEQTDLLFMGGSPGGVSEEPVTYEKRKKGWRMNCDVGEATEGLENELWHMWSDGKVGE